MRTDVPVRDVVLVGGGHAHVQVLRALGMNPEPGVRLTLVTRELSTPYSGMLPGHVAGFYTTDEMHIDLVRLARFAGARLIHAPVTRLQPEDRLLGFEGRGDLRYDVLSINCGAAPAPADGGVAVKPIGQFLPGWSQVLARGKAIVIIGGGPGGVELALAARAAAPDVPITLVGRTWLTGLNDRARALLRDACERRSIDVIAAQVTGQLEDRVELDNGQTIEGVDALWVTDVAAPPWLASSGLDVDEGGFARVTPTLQAVEHAEILVAGDAACLIGQERPKAGVYAVRAGPVLTHNLRALIRGEALKRFTPQKDFLTLIGTGDGAAVAAKWGLAWRSPLMWRWKDWIDRRFMTRFQDLPAMPEQAAPQLAATLQQDLPEAMRCGGCGAKLGASLLTRVLDRLPIQPSDRVIDGIGDDAAQFRTGASVLASTDGLRAMLDDPYRFGRITTHHNLNDLFAMGAQPTAALALATVPLMAEAMMEDELYQLLLGVVHVLEDHDVPLVGGHSGEGAELYLALTVLGEPGPCTFRKSGLAPGQELILTKPVGTGVVLAGEMRGLATAAEVGEAVATMDVSNASAVNALRDAQAVAVTDVTGFGLLGHLAEMLRASSAGARVRSADVPVLAGAERLMREGVASSIQGNNEQVLADFRVEADVTRCRVLCDPQTSGGLLAGVDASRAEACVERLRELGYPHASIIGEVVDEGSVVC